MNNDNTQSGGMYPSKTLPYSLPQDGGAPPYLAAAAGFQPGPSAGTACPAPPPYTPQQGPSVPPFPQLQPATAGAASLPPPPYVNENGPYVTPGTQPQPTTVIVTSPPMTTFILGNSCLTTPALIQCPSCHQQVITRISHSAGLLAWLICLGLIVVGCWLGCCLIPFCIDSCLDVNHHCPNCNHFIHKHKIL